MSQSVQPGETAGIGPFADNFIPVVPVDYEYHTAEYPFCYDPDCPCHTDEQAISQIKEQYDNGLITAEEAELIFKGKTV